MHSKEVSNSKEENVKLKHGIEKGLLNIKKNDFSFEIDRNNPISNLRQTPKSHHFSQQKHFSNICQYIWISVVTKSILPKWIMNGPSSVTQQSITWKIVFSEITSTKITTAAIRNVCTPTPYTMSNWWFFVDISNWAYAITVNKIHKLLCTIITIHRLNSFESKTHIS